MLARVASSDILLNTSQHLLKVSCNPHAKMGCSTCLSRFLNDTHDWYYYSIRQLLRFATGKDVRYHSFESLQFRCQLRSASCEFKVSFTRKHTWSVLVTKEQT